MPPGHSGLNLVSKEVTINLFVLGDLLSKNIWVAIATLRQHQLEKHLFSTDESGEDTDNQVKPKAVRFADGRRRTDRRSSCSTMILDELKARSRSKPEHPPVYPTHPLTPVSSCTPLNLLYPTLWFTTHRRGRARPTRLSAISSTTLRTVSIPAPSPATATANAGIQAQRPTSGRQGSPNAAARALP